MIRYIQKYFGIFCSGQYLSHQESLKDQILVNVKECNPTCFLYKFCLPQHYLMWGCNFPCNKNTHFVLFTSPCTIYPSSVSFFTYLLLFEDLYQIFKFLCIFYLSLYQKALSFYQSLLASYHFHNFNQI